MTLPQLPRKILRREDQPGYEKEVWQPSWHCFCCHDMGIVPKSLVRMVIPDYDPDKDLVPVCQNHGCEVGDHLWELEGCTDNRLTPDICAELERIERDGWRKLTLEKGRLIRAKSKLMIDELAQSKSLRPRDRLREEHFAAMQKHQEARLQ